MYWLLEKSVRTAMERAIQSGALPSIEAQAQYEARYFSAESDGPRLLTKAGDKAEIAVSGVITKAPSLLAMLFGGGNTTYSDINAAIAAAEQDPEVKELTFRVDSPGGQFDGLFDTLAAIESAEKPTHAIVSNVAASAAYAIVSQTDKITATNHAARVGSIGVVAGFSVDDDVIEITSTDAPKKRPDVTTEEGRAVVREELDAMHEIFADAIARGRKTTVKEINSKYGQGATLLAGEALERGMIDGIADTPLTVVKPAAAVRGGNKEEVRKMDLATFKAQHPETYEAAVQEGVKCERDRVGAHLTMGEASGDMKTACAAIKDGSEMTATLQSTYMAAGMNKANQTARQEDEAALAAAADGADADDALDAAAKDSEAVYSGLEAKYGIGG